MSTTVLALGLAEKVGEGDNKLENLVVNFAKLRGYRMPWVKIQELVTKSDWKTKSRNP